MWRYSPLARTDAVWLCVAVAAGLALRGIGLGWESLWYDEAGSLATASLPIAELVSGRALDAGNPWGYFVLLKLWTTLFGHSIESARALSAIAGALCVPAAWWLARSAGASPLVYRTAALLVAVSPPLVYLGREARTYALAATVCTVLAAAATRITRDGQRLAWIVLALSCAVFPYLHYSAFFVLAVLPIRILWAGRRDLGPAIARLAAVYLVAGLAFTPWLDTFITQLGIGITRSAETWWKHVVFLPSFVLVGRTLVWKEQGPWIVGAVEAVIGAGVLAPLLWQLRRIRPFPLAPLCLAIGVPLVPVLISLVRAPLFHSHYISPIFPCALVVLALGLGECMERRGRLRAVPPLLLAIVTVVSLGRMYAIPQKADWRGVANHVLVDAPELPVFFYHHAAAPTYAYYASTQIHVRMRERFTPGGEHWEHAGYLRTMQNEERFWLVLLLSNPELKAEEADILRWLDDRFALEDERVFSGVIRLLRYGRGSGDRASSSTRTAPPG